MKTMLMVYALMIVLTLCALGALLAKANAQHAQLYPGPYNLAQSIEIGPRGVYVDPDRRDWGRECAELRRACEESEAYGVHGEGNCHRYRQHCNGGRW
jgi:hypothetical protein